jgi:hypothetical protein
MSADVRLWPYDYEDSHNILWDGVVLDDTISPSKYITISEEYGQMTLPDIFNKWPHLMEKQFWGLAEFSDGTQYLHGRVG